MAKEFKWDITTEQAKLLVKDGSFYFDPDLSYEITGYRPITETQGLDFDPAPFTEVGRINNETRKYSGLRIGSRAHNLWWREQQRLCNEGMTHNGYRITGDNYFFLNFYTMNIMGTSGNVRRHPNFWVAHYKLFHYIEMCEKLGRDAAIIKARGVGLSEVAASLGVGPYTTRRGYQTIYTAYEEKYLLGKGIFTSKVVANMNWLNQNTEMGFAHTRDMVDKSDIKKASKKLRNGEEDANSWASVSSAQVTDKPDKLRGDRINRVFFEESGTNPVLSDTWVVSQALVDINGQRHGIRIAFGTGGSEGKYLATLSAMMTDYRSFDILPYRHNHTESGEYALSGFMLPSWETVMSAMDHRGCVNTAQAKQYYLDQRQYKKGLVLKKYCAETAFTLEECLSMEGENQFNQDLLAQQYVDIVINKKFKEPERGNLFWVRNDQNQITGVKFVPSQSGEIYIKSHPKLVDGQIPINLYVGGIDGIDQGVNDSVVGENGSKFAAVIKMRQFGLEGDDYVAYYKERPGDVRIAYENALKLSEYYNCKMNIERSKLNVASHFRNKGYTHRLYPTPQIANASLEESRAKRRLKKKAGQEAIGVPTSVKMIEYGLALVADYIEDSCHKITFVEIVKELQKYSYEMKTKFDLVAAIQMCEIADEDLFNRTIITTTKKKELPKIGNYIDEHGRRRFGVLKNTQKIQFNHALLTN